MHYRPAEWLVNLTRLNPKAAWPWRQSIRLAIAVTVPMVVGLITGQTESAILVALGALLNSIKVQSDPYSVRLHNFLIIVPIAMSGFVLGSLVSGHGLLTLVMLILVGILSGLISGYGAVFSKAAMQMLMLAVIAGAGHPPASIWLPTLLFAGGAAFAALLLGIEAAFDRHLPERTTLAQLLRSLSHLARIDADPPPAQVAAALDTPFERQRRHVTDAMLKAYSGLLETRLGNEGSTPDSNRRAAILSTASLIFSTLVAGGNSVETLHAAGHRLEQIAHAVAKSGARPAGAEVAPDAPLLMRYVGRLCDEIWPGEAPRTQAAAGASRPHPMPSPSLLERRWWLDRIGRLAPGRDVVISALRLALCLAIAFAAQSYLGGVRSYWIPLCVVIVLKPDFGSVFVRAMQRSIGTIIGVFIGVAILTLIPKGIWLFACMAALGLVLPGAGQRGYAMQCAFMTPLILILIDMTAQGTVDFGAQRLVDTLIGSGIAVVFGYLIWPRDPVPEIRQSFDRAVAASEVYLRAACATDAADKAAAPGKLFSAMTAAYRSLSNVRAGLQRAIAEPPPASREAAAWFPAVVEAERLCDRITGLAQLRLSGAVTLDPASVERRLARLEGLRTGSAVGGTEAPDALAATSPDADAAFQEVDFELARLSQLMQPAQ
ncbi:FUSC family protein [Kaistia defluvii]|uniref:FUSC family protein n=1 Tax=Kaistia defluvii TaxID=410841 RepID=UPI00224F5C5E|nr:FUSC family protein [Kaistia defluvii]MCX5517199.1 FUSC family protein [Kaistia defluvii]